MSEPTLEHLDPRTLLVDTNIRSDLRLDADFVASVRDCGVIVPIVAERTEQGIRVRAGHRRTAAAVEAGRDTVPVMVVDGDGDGAQRIIEQLIENTHRAGLSAADTVAAVEQLALLGCSATQIRIRTRIPRSQVEQALAVADSEASRDAVKAEGITLEMAAWLAEFEDDPEVWDSLVQGFHERPHQARHAVERARRERQVESARIQAALQVQASHPGAAWYTGELWEDKAAERLTMLRDLDEQTHAGCPGHGFQLRATGGWGGPGDVSADGVDFDVIWLCTDWKANGHSDRLGKSDAQEVDSEQARQERRQTVALNRAGEAAKVVREEWLTAFTKDRGAPPKDWPVFMVTSLHHDHVAPDDKHSGWRHVRELIGLDDDGVDAIGDPNRAARLLVAARLWTYERRAGKDIWRQDTQRLYIQYLESWGYELSDVEQSCAGWIEPAEAYRRIEGDA